EANLEDFGERRSRDPSRVVQPDRVRKNADSAFCGLLEAEAGERDEVFYGALNIVSILLFDLEVGRSVTLGSRQLWLRPGPNYGNNTADALVGRLHASNRPPRCRVRPEVDAGGEVPIDHVERH